MKRLLIRLPIALAAVAAPLVAGLATVLVFIKSVDLTEYRDLVAKQVREATGRDLVLKGGLNLGELDPLAVRATEIRPPTDD